MDPKIVPFFSTLGMELTWLYPRKRGESEWITSFVNALKARFDKNNIAYYDIYNDGDALEVATPGFSCFQDIEKYYFVLIDQINIFPEMHKLFMGRRSRLVYNREDTVSGGGHIHVAIPKRILEGEPIWLFLFLGNIFRDINNRPYLNWIFNDWGNIQSAKSFVDYKEGFLKEDYHYDGFEKKNKRFDFRENKLLNIIFSKNPRINPEITRDYVFETFSHHKGYAIRFAREEKYDNLNPYSKNEPGKYKPVTIEFRFLDTKRSLEEIRLHVNFVNAYLRYIEQKTISGELVEIKVHTLRDINYISQNDRCLKRFREFLNEIGLDHQEYEFFIDKNYRRRAKGKLLF